MSDQSLDLLDDRLKQVIQTLYTIQVCAHGYAGPETQQELIRLISTLGPQVNSTIQFAPGSLPFVPPEVISYVDSGRNPDIYTREFVERVIRENAFFKGKSDAFAEFRDVLAAEIVDGLGEDLKPLVGKAIGGGGSGDIGSSSSVGRDVVKSEKQAARPPSPANGS